MENTNQPLPFEYAESAKRITAGTVLATKDGRQVNVISNNDATYTVELDGQRAEYRKIDILTAIQTGRMTVETK